MLQKYSFFFGFIFFWGVHTQFQAQTKKQMDSINQLDYVYVSNNLEKSKSLFIRNIEQAKKNNYRLCEAKSRSNLALVYSLQGDYDLSVNEFIGAANIYAALGQHQELASTYANIGYRIRYVDVNKAIYYFRKAIAISQKHKLKSGLVAIYNNFGETLKQVDYDSSLFYYKKSLYLARLENDSIAIPFSLNNMCEEYARRKEFDLAFKCLNESDFYRFRVNDEVGKADNWAYRGDIYFEMPNHTDSAIHYYKKSFDAAKKLNYHPLKRYNSQKLAILLQKKGAFKEALNYFQIHKDLEDSVLNVKVQNQLANLQVQFQTEHTSRELAEEKANSAKKGLELQSRQKWILVASSSALILLLILIFVYRYQRAKRKSAVKEIELKKQLEASHLESEFANEKIRISRELHDNIGSHLTFIISSLDNLGYVNNPQQKIDKISDLSNFGRQTMKDLRDTIWAMNHEEGSFDQLLVRISALRSVLPENLEVRISDEIKQDFALNGLQLLNCFRIVQEFIQNTIKYAEAHTITLGFGKTDQHFTITLNDDGIGFDLKATAFGNGIHNMRKRCEDLFGTFTINSSPDGTKVTCQIPLHPTDPVQN